MPDFPSVSKLSVEGTKRKLSLTDGSELMVHRFAPIGKGDRIRLGGPRSRPAVFVVCRNGEAKIVPAFSKTVGVPGFNEPIRIKEIETDAELSAYQRLAGYHYRSQDAFGRRAILVAKIGAAKNAKVIGYLEICNTFAGHESRNRVLNAPFASPGVQWSKWDLPARNLFINSIARISRCVVHPEYRGIGVGTILCKGAIDFCKSSWQIAGLKPIFLEITADMLKFVPFVESAGMRYVGTTTGNLRRLLKDQSYLRGVRDDIDSGTRESDSHSVFAKGAKSILKRQKRDVDDMARMSKESGVEMMQVLRTYIDATAPEELPPSAYALLSKFLRFPKPTYMAGLTREADAFLVRRIGELGVNRPRDAPNFSIDALRRPITLNALTIAHTIPIPSDAWANALQEAFGIHQGSLSVTGLREVSLSIAPKEIFYVWGPSGSGKTLLLDAIRGAVMPSSGQVTGIHNDDIGVLELTFSDRPIALEVGGADLSEALYALNMVGLSEANLYFKAAKHLSNGQRYRLGLAKLMTSRRPIWLIDEFCSVLDDNTAELISWNFGRFARKAGATAIVAGPRKHPVIAGLRPDRVLLLDSLGDWRIERGTDL